MFDPAMMRAMTGGGQEQTDDNYFANYNGIMGGGQRKRPAMPAPPGPPGTAPLTGMMGIPGGQPMMANGGDPLLAAALMNGPPASPSSAGRPMMDDSLPVGEALMPGQGRDRRNNPGQGKGTATWEGFDRLMAAFGSEPGYFTNLGATRAAAKATPAAKPAA